MARRQTDDNGAELVPGSAAERYALEERAKAVQTASAPLETGVNQYWGGRTSDQTRAADNKAREEELKRINVFNKDRDANSLARENTDRLIAANEAKTAREESKLDTQLKIAEMRWGPDGALGGSSGGGGGGGNRRGGRTPDEMAHEAALEVLKRPVAPGQKAESYPDIMRLNRQAYVAPPPVPGTTASSATTLGATSAQTPALPQNQLSEARWKQYGDQKGLAYQGLQPGMQNDQIARFMRPDGVAHFVNAGAANNALAGTPQPSADARAMRLGPGPTAPVTETLKVDTKSIAPVKENFAWGSQETGVSEEQREQSIEPKVNWDAFIGKPTTVPNTVRQSHLPFETVQNSLRPVHSASQPTVKSPEIVDGGPTEEALKATPGLLEWWKKTSKRNMPKRKPVTESWFTPPKTSTNPLFPNYEQ